MLPLTGPARSRTGWSGLIQFDYQTGCCVPSLTDVDTVQCDAAWPPYSYSYGESVHLLTYLITGDSSTPQAFAPQVLPPPLLAPSTEEAFNSIKYTGPHERHRLSVRHTCNERSRTLRPLQDSRLFSSGGLRNWKVETRVRIRLFSPKSNHASH